MTNPKVYILIADDDFDKTRVLMDLVTDQGYTPLVVINAEQALALARTLSLDLTLVDVRMPGPSSSELAALLKEIHFVFHCLIKLLSTIKDTQVTQQAQRWVQSGDLVIDLQQRQVILRDKPVALTALEFDFLTYLAQHRNRVVSYAELLEQVWDCSPGCGAPKWVQLTVSRLRHKLNDDSVYPRYIVNVRGIGYQLK